MNTTHKLHALTGLRFIAAFLVIWHHGHRWLPDHLETKLAALGVSFFFSLSGFVLYYNYSNLKLKNITLHDKK